MVLTMLVLPTTTWSTQSSATAVFPVCCEDCLDQPVVDYCTGRALTQDCRAGDSKHKVEVRGQNQSGGVVGWWGWSPSRSVGIVSK